MTLSLDISGNFKRNKGTTGWALVDGDTVVTYGIIQAVDYKTAMEYYYAHTVLIEYLQDKHQDLAVVIEDYILYAEKAGAQTNQRSETTALLGILEYYCWCNGVTQHTQTAATVKTRWTDAILEHEGYVLPKGKTARHVKDAIRHAVHYEKIIKRRKNK